MALVISDKRLLNLHPHEVFVLSPFTLANSSITDLYDVLRRLRIALYNPKITHIFCRGELATTICLVLSKGVDPKDITPQHLLMHHSFNLKNLQLQLLNAPIRVRIPSLAASRIICHLPNTDPKKAIETTMNLKKSCSWNYPTEEKA